MTIWLSLISGDVQLVHNATVCALSVLRGLQEVTA